ncbi:MAG: phage tail protein [Paracoccaceae bacterium]
MALPPTEYPKNPQRLTPYPNFRFKVKWPEASGNPTYVAGMSRVSALTRQAHVIRHREGGDPSTMHLAPGQTEYSPITFERGVSYDPSFEQWANKVFDHRNSQNTDGEMNSLRDFRKNLTLEVYNEAGQMVLAYHIYNAWVSEYQAMSDLDANGRAASLIQSMTVENEGWERDDSIKPETEPTFTLPSSQD